MLDRINEVLVLLSNTIISPVSAQWKSSQGSSMSMDQLIKKLIDLAVIFAGVISVIYMVYSGIRYTMSAGDAGRTKEATQGITNALMGLVVALIAYVAVDFVFKALGTSIGGSVENF